MHRTARGQSGLDRLLVFVIVVIVVVAALPTLLGVAGVDVRQSPDPDNTTTPTPTPRPAELQVLNASADVTNASANTVGVVRVTVTKVGSAATVDTSDVAVTWAGQRVFYLTPAGVDRPDSDGPFVPSVDHVGEDTGLVLGETGDRATLTFDVGTDDVPDLGEFGTPLTEGETVDIVLATADGRTTTATLRVPESLENRSVVGL